VHADNACLALFFIGNIEVKSKKTTENKPWFDFNMSRLFMKF
jgi:hypothetical protein